MPSKNIYAPSTQGYATFATAHTSTRSDELSHGIHLGAKTIITKVRELVANNTGLLLVTASQAFFALMNVAVKKLNSLDPPVPPLEVCLNFCSARSIYNNFWGIAHICSDGE